MNEYDVVVRRRPRGAESYEEHLTIIAENRAKAVSAAKRAPGGRVRVIDTLRRTRRRLEKTGKRLAPAGGADARLGYCRGRG